MFFHKLEVVFQTVYTIIQKSLNYSLIKNFLFLPTYYSRNENLWVDGFLIDFLQKKSVDLWLRKFVIYTGFLFSERLLFDAVIRLYLDVLIWPAHYISIFAAANVTELLNTTLYFYFSIFSLLSLFYLYWL